MRRNAQPVEGYSTEELFELWRNFRDDPHADKILSDFMGASRKAAASLIDDFETVYQSNLLDAGNRGKEAPREHW